MSYSLDVSALPIDDAGCRLATLLTRNGSVTEQEFCEVERAAEVHGVLPLLASHAEGARARSVLREAAARDAACTAAVADALQVLRAAGIRVLVLKGAHLALTHYPASYLRPRSDADLLIPAAARDETRRTLEAAGFTLVPHVRGDLILTQMHFTREADPVLHTLDIHWQAVNPHAFRDLLPFDDVWARSRPIPALGLAARGLCDADAMLLATIHPVAHHCDDLRLFWIADIDRLVAGMSAAMWDDFVRRARRARVARVVLASLTTARELLHTTVPNAVLEQLGDDGTDQRATAAYLLPATKARRLWWDLQALDGWRTRARYMRQHLFPDRDYMRRRHGDSLILLPWRYMWRIASGAARWLRH